MGTCSTASRCELSPNRAIDWLPFTLLLQRRHAFATAKRPRHSALRDGEGALGKRGLTHLPYYYGIIGSITESFAWATRVGVPGCCSKRTVIGKLCLCARQVKHDSELHAVGTLCRNAPAPMGSENSRLYQILFHRRGLLRCEKSDVMGTGHHAALAAKVDHGKRVAVVGDGAVGLCGVIAARRLGAEQIIILGRHPDRIALAKAFGATD